MWKNTKAEMKSYLVLTAQLLQLSLRELALASCWAIISLTSEGSREEVTDIDKQKNWEIDNKDKFTTFIFFWTPP